MATAEKQVQLTISLPESVADVLAGAASQSHRSIDEELQFLIEWHLADTRTPEELLRIAREEYEAELARTGKRRPTTEELWEQMRRIREEVANERYPD